MKNTNKGITLIALVITIIVMLILVAVTINMAVNGGLFGYAGNAARETEEAKEQEEILGSGIAGGKRIEDWVQGGDSLLPNTQIPAGGVYVRMSDMTSYYSQITNTEKTIINGIFSSYGYSITFDDLQYGGETPPEGIQTLDAYLYGDYAYSYNYTNPDIGLLEGWAATVWDTTKSSYGEILNSINGENLTHLLGTFMDCTSLTTAPRIPNSVTNIGSAFANCTSLTTAPTIPSSVTSIGDHAFLECTSLTSVTIPSSITSLGEGAFMYCSGLTNITIPSSVTSIGDYAFNYCTSLTNITIPNGVTSIGLRCITILYKFNEPNNTK